jgi:hypothetical protein
LSLKYRLRNRTLSIASTAELYALTIDKFLHEQRLIDKQISPC